MSHRVTVTLPPILCALACDATSGRDAAWEAFRDAHAIETPDGEEILVVEGDLAVDEAELLARWETDDASADPFRATGTPSGGAVLRWSAGQELALRYCVSDEYEPTYHHPSARTLMENAARHWERVAHVDFVYVPAADADCVAGNPLVTFAVRPWDGGPGIVSFFPSAPADVRTIWMNPFQWVISPRTVTTQSLVTHALGHVLGLRHENVRPEGGGCSDGVGPWAALGPYDRYSVMQHYACPGSADGLVQPTVLDQQAVRRLYGPPKRVEHAPVDRNADGVLEIGTLYDCDGDRYSDLVARVGTTLVCARTTGGGTLTASTPGTGALDERDAAWGDFTGRGAVEYGALWNSVQFSATGSTGPRTSVSATEFLNWSRTTQDAVPVVGRFDANARVDVALLGVGWWATTPVLFGPAPSENSMPATVTNHGSGAFAAWSAQPGVRIAPGDFDADGLTDIALVGGVGWVSVPIAFSRGGGTWDVRNVAIAGFASWASEPEAVVHAGDFDGDGDSDLAMTGPSWWTTIPVARSLRDGSFAVTNHAVADFPSWTSVSGVSTLAADFDGDGCTDLAATGGSWWTTIPVARSGCNGTFTVHNNTVADFPQRAAQGARPIVGYFDLDRRADLALIGELDRLDVVMALSRGTSFVASSVVAPDFSAGVVRPISDLPPG